jgi:hypothetical protein
MSLYDAVDEALKVGLNGIAICNHEAPFYLSDIPSDLEEKYNITINPTNPCDNAFYIITGVEEKTDFGHMLKLFIKEKDNFSVNVIAHPFQRHFNYGSRSKELLTHIDKIHLVEGFSARANYKNKNACQMAQEFADNNKLSLCAGSDAHFKCEIGNAWVEFPDSIFGVEEIKSSLVNGNCSFFYKNSKKRLIAESQIHKNGFAIKSILFWFYCVFRDLGDLLLCQK